MAGCWLTRENFFQGQRTREATKTRTHATLIESFTHLRSTLSMTSLMTYPRIYNRRSNAHLIAHISNVFYQEHGHSETHYKLKPVTTCLVHHFRLPGRWTIL